MGKSTIVFTEVSGLYSRAITSTGKWMWRNHTQWVADKAEKLAEKYGANTEKVYCAALLHDLGDAKYERGHADFVNWSETKGSQIQILLGAGFDEDGRAEVKENYEALSRASGTKLYVAKKSHRERSEI